MILVTASLILYMESAPPALADAHNVPYAELCADATMPEEVLVAEKPPSLHHLYANDEEAQGPLPIRRALNELHPLPRTY